MKTNVYAGGVLALLIALSGCAISSPGSDPTAGSSREPTPSASADASTPAAPAPSSIVIGSTMIRVVDEAGSTVLELDYQSGDAAIFERLADALGVDASGEFVPTPSPMCAQDTTRYDFDGFVVETPNNFGPGAFQIHVTSPATSSGVSITTVNGVEVGQTEAEFFAAAGQTVPMWTNEGITAVGFELMAEQAGSQAVFEGGALTDIWTPRYLDWDC